MDVYQGRFLREHHDLDYLTLELGKYNRPLTEFFQNSGWQVQPLVNGDLKLINDEIEIQLGNVIIAGEACWTHNGRLGSLFFPLAWLNDQSKKFYDIEIHVVEPELQYVLYNHP
jgi:hypothetical protein